MVNPIQIYISLIRVTFQEDLVIRTCIVSIQRRYGNSKISKGSYYHCIKCTAATFPAAFMLKRPLNSAAFATITNRKLERVFDRTDTQVRAQMINKCMIKMVQREIYNGRDSP